MSRLGRGQLETARKGESTPSTKDAQNIFLERIREHAPQVLVDLRGEPYRLFRETGLYYEADASRAEDFDLAKRFAWTHFTRLAWKDIEKPFKNPLVSVHLESTRCDAHVEAFAQSLFTWSRKHNLDALWCRARAYETLDFWCRSPESVEEQLWNFDFPFASLSGGGNKFTFEYETHFPAYGFRKDVKAEITEAFAKQLAAFLDDAERSAVQHGLKPTSQKRNFDHFAWLVDHQVNGLGYGKMLEKYQGNGSFGTSGINISSLSEAITNTAALIDLPLRPEQGRS